MPLTTGFSKASNPAGFLELAPSWWCDFSSTQCVVARYVIRRTSIAPFYLQQTEMAGFETLCSSVNFIVFIGSGYRSKALTGSSIASRSEAPPPQHRHNPRRRRAHRRPDEALVRLLPDPLTKPGTQYRPPATAVNGHQPQARREARHMTHPTGSQAITS